MKLYVSTKMTKVMMTGECGMLSPLSFSGWLPGCVGIMPVFESEEAAELYAPGMKSLIMEV